MSGLLSKGITLSHMVAEVPTALENLLEIPDLGGKVDKVEVTTLSDASKKYIQGIKDFGDLEFKFLYDNETVTSNYRVLKALETAGTDERFIITFPDTTVFAFSGAVMTSIDAAKVGDALQFTMSLTLSSDIVPTDPTGV